MGDNWWIDLPGCHIQVRMGRPASLPCRTNPGDRAKLQIAACEVGIDIVVACWDIAARLPRAQLETTRVVNPTWKPRWKKGCLAGGGAAAVAEGVERDARWALAIHARPRAQARMANQMVSRVQAGPDTPALGSTPRS